jgi:hypothetical protein
MLTFVPHEAFNPIIFEPYFSSWNFNVQHEDNLELLADRDYFDSLQSDPVAACRKLVVACRASSLRRFEWNNTILAMKAKKELPEDARVLQLLRDMVVRWSSTYSMIDRAIEMRPVSCRVRSL